MRSKGNRALIAGLEVLELSLAPVELVVPDDESISRTRIICSAQALLHVASIGHLRGNAFAAKTGEHAGRLGLGSFPEGHEHQAWLFARRRVDHHCEPLDSSGPADRRRMRSTERFDEAVVTTAGNHRALRAEAVGDELERRVAIIIEAADEPRVALPRHARSVETGGYGSKEVRGLGGQMLIHVRRIGADRTVLRVLAVEDPQRIALEPGDTVLRQIRPVPFKIIDERSAPRLARFGIAERVEFERHPVGDPELAQKLVAEAQQLDVGLRFGGANDLGVQLVELAEAALLRPFVPKRRTVGRDLERHILLPSFAQICAADSRGEFRPERDRIAAAVLERIHFLGHDVGSLADAAREHRRLLDGRHLDPPEPEQPAHAIECRDHRGKAVGIFSKQALRAPNGLNRRHRARLKHKNARCGISASAIGGRAGSPAASSRTTAGTIS